MKNSVLKRFWNTALLLTASVVLGSCNAIYEDLPTCDIYVDFRYDYNMSGEDNFARQCDKVELFVFDSEGVLRFRNAESGEALSRSDYRMRVPVESGEYTVVAWAGHKQSYDLSQMQVGVSTREELTLRMQRNADATRASELEPLWHGMATFTYAGSAEHTQTVSLVKSTNTLNLSLTNVSDKTAVSVENISARVVAANGSYNYDNSLREDDPITYLPHSATASGLSFSVLRLVKGEDVRLIVTDKTSGSSLLPDPEMDLISYLLLTKPDAKMSDQEFLDRQDSWNIEVDFSSGDTDDEFVVLSITINGWVVWIHSTEL